MSDITTVSPSQYVDLFATKPEEGATQQDNEMRTSPVRFSASGEQSVDIFAKQESATPLVDPAQVDPPADPLEAPADPNAPATVDPPANDPDLFKPKAGRPAKNNFSDLSGYFEDRLKAGKFVAINEEGEDGVVKPFIPKTPEDFDEVIDLQVRHQLDKGRKDLEKSWYQSKTPAWQAVAKYSELVDDPADILPFIQGVKTIESVESVDPSEIAGAEVIVRARLEQLGNTQDAIDETIDALKTTDKLVARAQKDKPIILQTQKAELSKMVQERQHEEQEYMQMVEGIRENAVKAIETPMYGKHKLKQEEKAAIYSMIAIPSEESQGYRIYSKIDDLYRTGDFEKLKKIALILEKEDSFLSYVASGTANAVAEGLQRRLRVAADANSSSSNSNNEGDDDNNKPTINRNKYTPKFGR